MDKASRYDSLTMPAGDYLRWPLPFAGATFFLPCWMSLSPSMPSSSPSEAFSSTSSGTSSSAYKRSLVVNQLTDLFRILTSRASSRSGAGPLMIFFAGLPSSCALWNAIGWSCWLYLRVRAVFVAVAILFKTASSHCSPRSNSTSVS